MEKDSNGKITHVDCYQLSTNSILTLAFHLTQDPKFMKRHGLEIRDPEYKMELNKNKPEVVKKVEVVSEETFNKATATETKAEKKTKVKTETKAE
jgi:hypothetical protein